MKCNVGKTDRAVRVVAGVAMIAAGLYFQNWWGAVGIVPIATGLFRWCPTYLPFGIKTS